MSQRIRWVEQRASRGADAKSAGQVLLALIRGNRDGARPVADPAGNGIQPDGSLRFTDWEGKIQTAQIGDEIEVDEAGWELVREQTAPNSTNSEGQTP